MYTLETLSEINSRFLSDHRLSQWDVDMVNKHINDMKFIHQDNVVGVGDTLRYTNKHGEYYKNALINSIESDNEVYICEVPYVPFLSVDKDSSRVWLSTSGGKWTHIPLNELTWIGAEQRLFSDWGNCGACGNGSVQFYVTVNVWEYIEDSLFDGYTNEQYDKMHIRYVADKFGNPTDGSSYVYFGNYIAFANKAEYDYWLQTYKGKKFNGYSENQDVVFYYKKHEHLISKEEWDKLDLPVDTRVMNASTVMVKVRYNDDENFIDVYRYTNRNESWTDFMPYMLARKNQVPKQYDNATF